jgi:NAD(P)-dependent dehydrogenase (short-subunit alcohol dehydrogenase family)
MASQENATDTVRWAVVAGGGAGIGAATTSALQRDGWSVAVLDINIEAARRALGSGEGIALLYDGLNDTSVAATFAEIAAKTDGRIGALVTVVGGSGKPSAGKLLEELDRAAWDETLAFNATSAFLAIRAALPLLRRNGKGAIVTIASGTARRGQPLRLAAYAAGKAAVQGLTRALAWELGPAGIRINSVSPGLVLTERLHRTVPAQELETRASKIRADTALNRLATADDVAAVCAFLVSDAAQGMTGRDLPVDGGWLP